MLIPIDSINYYIPPLFFQSNDTIQSLYDTINRKIPSVSPAHKISIIFKERILLNLVNDNRTIRDFGFCNESNDIQIIEKPDCVALLEMLGGITNIRNIPWIDDLFHCISDPSATNWRTISQSEKRLEFDDNGHLIAINLCCLKLTGTVHLESMPQSVRSLDLSFNDLDSLNLDELRGELDRLNVEMNRRCQLISRHSDPRFGHNLPIKVLRISSNVLIINGVPMLRGHSMPFYYGMLNVVRGVTNKERIPWYDAFLNGQWIAPERLRSLGIDYQEGIPKVIRIQFGRSRRPCSFDLSGLGLKGHIDLGFLPKNVIGMDLSNNHLSRITFASNSQNNLRELNMQINDHLRFDLGEMERSLTACTFYRLCTLRISSNQIQQRDIPNEMEMNDFLRYLLRASSLLQIFVDEKQFSSL